MKQEKVLYQDFLQSKNLKLTKPRLIIMEAVLENHDHFNVDDLYEQIKMKHKDVSRATIYRTIPLLIESGLVKQSLRCESKDIYEHTYGHENHLHFICTNCGKILESSFNEVEKLINQLAKNENFKISEYNLGASGLCKDCKK
ncbi:MAG: Fur family transcriptional regulator [Candidatus Cloacimonetes bacterium]|jgi:Fur family ferric uptake transcriptional regulator|nr:Fur family transcriptional regulator [Candidatus Cloacimonadota bacterium]